MLFSEPKIPQEELPPKRSPERQISVLFSEPKIPQSASTNDPASATAFQCSSASRKFLNQSSNTASSISVSISVLFSEPKIPQLARKYGFEGTVPFQCSSASRKFLNVTGARGSLGDPPPFQCSSASRKFLNALVVYPQALIRSISVLFSEPKIPQCFWGFRCVKYLKFQCSSASRKFLNCRRRIGTAPATPFQCSSASRKFLNSDVPRTATETAAISVLFSEPKIPQFGRFLRVRDGRGFQCSSASRKFLKLISYHNPRRLSSISVLFSEPKIPQTDVRF